MVVQLDYISLRVPLLVGHDLVVTVVKRGIRAPQHPRLHLLKLLVWILMIDSLRLPKVEQSDFCLHLDRLLQSTLLLHPYVAIDEEPSQR